MDKILAAIILAHSWYDPACCSERDCHRYEGTVIEGPSGYQLQNGMTVPYADPRVRQGFDEDYHICLNSSGALLCFYRPARGA